MVPRGGGCVTFAASSILRRQSVGWRGLSSLLSNLWECLLEEERDEPNSAGLGRRDESVRSRKNRL